MFILKPARKKNSNSSAISALFLVTGLLLLAYSMLFGFEVAALIGLGLTFWGVLFAFARKGKYVESSLLDATAKSAYSTLDRMINDLKFNGQGYYIPAYPKDVNLPEYLKNLKESVVFISDNFDGKPPVDDLTAGRFLSEKKNGVFVTSPGSELVAQMERRLKLDFSQIPMNELVEILPNCLTETFNLAKSVEMSLAGSGVSFKASGILYQSLYRADPPLKSLSILGCPVVSAVASVLAKSSGKTVMIKEQGLSPGDCGFQGVFNFV